MSDANEIVRQRQSAIRREMDRRGIALKAVSFDADVRKLDQAGVISTLARVSDVMRQRRDSMRLREVV